MPSIERDDSRDRELVRHSHTFSDSRMIPMWDSSDPDRAPPPLPLNPGSPKMTTRPNTSAAIMQAAKALEEKARESLPASSYTVNPMPQRSPERSLIKGTQHKRMHTLQPSSVRDLRSYLDNHKSPDRSLDRSPDRSAGRGVMPSRDLEKDPFARDLDLSPLRLNTPTPPVRFDIKEPLSLRPSHKPVLGENTPPSATMVALQTMTIPPHVLEAQSLNLANSSPRPSPSPPQPFDSISSQLLNINNIVSNLQRDMSQLSRRSKDNATDLISLKEATSSRDEDIRKSLKDLMATMSQKQHAATTAAAFPETPHSNGLNLRDPHMTPNKQFTFPRMPSPSAWTDERIGSPNPYSVEGAASVAMLEKIIREMVTKDGQERLIASLQKLVDKATGDTAKKVTELAEFVKQGSNIGAFGPPVVPNSATFSPSTGSSQLTRTTSEGFPLSKLVDSGKPYTSPKAADFVSDEMLKFLRKIKDSVTESGCVTMSTKALIQDLRGEVLGMGRELARKVEEAESTRMLEPGVPSDQANHDINAIVQQGLDNLKDYMDKVMLDRRRQSISSAVTRNTIDSNEVYDVVKHALAERGLDQHPTRDVSLDKEAIVNAIREAYDSVEMKPNVEMQQFGLEREEILQCLREGLEDFKGSGAITKEEVEDIVYDSLHKMRLPPPINEAQETREEVLMAVRECLEDFKPSLTPSHVSDAISRELLHEVVKDALSEHQPEALEVDIPPEAIFDAVKAAIDASKPQMEAHNNAVMQQLQSLLTEMHSEFKAYSSANGRDTEQVLDALRDGIDSLRNEIHGSADDALNEQVVDRIRVELQQLREDVQGYVAEGPRGDQAWSRGEMVSYIKSEFEHLHEELTSQFLPASKEKEEILTALALGFQEMKSQVTLHNDDPESNDEINEALKHEFDQLKDILLGGTTSQKNDIIEKLQAGFDGLHALISDRGLPTSSDSIPSFVKEEFEHLRQTLGTALIQSGSSADQDTIVNTVRELVDGLRSSQDVVMKENSVLILTELEALKESLGGALVPTNDNDKTEMLATVKASLEDVKTRLSSAGINHELLEAFRGELEQIRHSDTLTREHSRADTEETLEAIRLGLDDLRSHLEKKLDGPGPGVSASSDIIDVVNDGFEGLRNEVAKLTGESVDMAVTHEILDTLRQGLAGLQEDINQLKTQGRSTDVMFEETAPFGHEVVLMEDPERAQPGDRGLVPETFQSNHVEKMEFILAQIQDKVDAMHGNVQAPMPPAESVPLNGPATKEDLFTVEELIKDVQAAVLLQDREIHLEGLARKEDTDAIETLLANTKARIEEIVPSDSTTAITKENLDDVELVVRTTADALDALSKKMEDEIATKADVTVVQVMVDDIKQVLDEVKAAKSEDVANPQATRADVEAMTLLIDDLKLKLDEMRIPDPEDLPSKAEVEQLTGLIHDFRESHDKMRDTYEEDIVKTAKNFDDRREEAETMIDDIANVKTVLQAIGEEIKTQFTEGGPVHDLQQSLVALEETIGANNVTADVKELMELVLREFERAHGSIEGLQNDQAEKSTLQLEKHDEVKDFVIASVIEKLDEKFDALMVKYDDAQMLADDQARVMKEKSEEQEKLLGSTKTMADELRLTIDTLGSTITGTQDRFEDVTTKWSTDSTTIFEKISVALSTLEEHKLDDKMEHSHTRDEIKNVEATFSSLQDNITEYHPKFLSVLGEIEALVKSHYEHTQQAKAEHEEWTRTWSEQARSRSEELQAHFTNLPKLLPAPASATEVHERYDDAPVQEKLDKLLAIAPPDVYDDAVVQGKLDKLICHADNIGRVADQDEKLNEIHAQIKLAVDEISEFVTKQTHLITDGNESKEQEAEELTLLIERKMTQKEQLEVDLESLRAERATHKEVFKAEIQDLKAEKERIVQGLEEEKERVMAELKEEKERTVLELREEKDSLLAIVAALQVERENLANQKVRLTGEVSSLHTALEIRREELHFMDAKADALERRILNGIMDHSRALMMAKGTTKGVTKATKRVNIQIAHESNKSMPPPSIAAHGLSLALKPRPGVRRNTQSTNPAQRRILSLSQISGNVPSSSPVYPVSDAVHTNGGLKRSHSVKNTHFARKPSWAGRPNMAETDKENSQLKEEDENEVVQKSVLTASSIVQEDRRSETGTERRYSIDSHSYAESYAEGEVSMHDSRSSLGGTDSEYTYASGSSYVTESNVEQDRRTSYGSRSARSFIDDENDIDEDSEHSSSEDEEPTATLHLPEGSTIPMPTYSEIDRAVQAVKAEMNHDYTAPNDSGVGSELATAVLESQRSADKDSFRRAAEEEGKVG